MKVLVTGSSGMVGLNLINYKSASSYNILSPSSSELDLTSFFDLNEYLQKNKPDFIIHCAGLVGGIQDNINRPYHFFSQNIKMGQNLIWAAVENDIDKLINLGSSCMYPKNRNEALRESEILSGPLEPTNEGYAIAKIAIAKLCEYTNAQFGKQYKTIIPCNLYGKWDKFDPKKSHMIPAVIDKIHKAKVNDEKFVEIWGDGSARREFMYAEDLADFIWYCVDNFNKLDLYTNVGLGYDYSIKEYYEIIADVVGYNNEFNLNLDKPSGMSRKLCSVEKQDNLGWKPKFSIKDGIKNTYEYYLKNYAI